MSEFEIAFIGAGNMARSIIGGLLSSGHRAGALRAADPNAESLAALRGLGDIATGHDNAALIAGARVVILAVKPQVMAAVCAGLRETVVAERPLVISIAAGIGTASLARWLGAETAIVRCMPNTPALLGCGATGLFAGATVDGAQRAQAEAIMAAVGTTCWVSEESQLDAVTAVSGSGPAYFFQFMEAMAAQGAALGLEPAVAAQLSVQTCLGAARMAAQSGVDLAELRQRVCSPGGTTERAVASLAQDDLGAVVGRAMRAAYERAQEMARELDTDAPPDPTTPGDPART